MALSGLSRPPALCAYPSHTVRNRNTGLRDRISLGETRSDECFEEELTVDDNGGRLVFGNGGDSGNIPPVVDPLGLNIVDVTPTASGLNEESKECCIRTICHEFERLWNKIQDTVHGY